MRKSRQGCPRGTSEYAHGNCASVNRRGAVLEKMGPTTFDVVCLQENKDMPKLDH